MSALVFFAHRTFLGMAAPGLEVRQDPPCENEMFTVVGGVEEKKKKKRMVFRKLAIRETLSKSQCVAYHCSFAARLFVLVLRAYFLSARRKKWRKTN